MMKTRDFFLPSFSQVLPVSTSGENVSLGKGKNDDSTDPPRPPFSSSDELKRGLGGLLECDPTPAGVSSLWEPYFFCERLRKSAKLLNNQWTSFKLPESWTLLAVPDFSGALAPGQVVATIRLPNGAQKTLRGEVLCLRIPAYLPGDVRKFQAVPPPKELTKVLTSRTGFLIFSAERGADSKLARAEIAKLSGGDYDGDTVIVIAWPELVACFGEGKYQDEVEEAAAQKVGRRTFLGFGSLLHHGVLGFSENHRRLLHHRVTKDVPKTHWMLSLSCSLVFYGPHRSRPPQIVRALQT